EHLAVSIGKAPHILHLPERRVLAVTVAGRVERGAVSIWVVVAGEVMANVAALVRVLSERVEVLESTVAKGAADEDEGRTWLFACHIEHRLNYAQDGVIFHEGRFIDNDQMGLVTTDEVGAVRATAKNEGAVVQLNLRKGAALLMLDQRRERGPRENIL